MQPQRSDTLSFEFLPSPIYLAICIIISIFLIYITLKRRRIDRKCLQLLYLTIAIGTLTSAVIRVIKETTNIYSIYFNNIGYILLGYAAVIMLELAFLSVTHKGSEKSKRIIILGWSFILVPLMLASFVYLILD